MIGTLFSSAGTHTQGGMVRGGESPPEAEPVIQEIERRMFLSNSQHTPIMLISAAHRNDLRLASFNNRNINDVGCNGDEGATP